MRSSAATAFVSTISSNTFRPGQPSKVSAVVEMNEFSSMILSGTQAAVGTAETFEPILPSATSLVGMFAVVVLSVIAAVVWNNQVVPVSRTKLAISKARGEVKEFLEDIRDAPDKGFEQWLLSDWLDNNKSEKSPAIPILKKAKWNSGDNPVVVTATLMMVGILIASVSERVL